MTVRIPRGSALAKFRSDKEKSNIWQWPVLLWEDIIHTKFVSSYLTSRVHNEKRRQCMVWELSKLIEKGNVSLLDCRSPGIFIRQHQSRHVILIKAQDTFLPRGCYGVRSDRATLQWESKAHVNMINLVFKAPYGQNGLGRQCPFKPKFQITFRSEKITHEGVNRLSGGGGFGSDIFTWYRCLCWWLSKLEWIWRMLLGALWDVLLLGLFFHWFLRRFLLDFIFFCKFLVGPFLVPCSLGCRIGGGSPSDSSWTALFLGAPAV